MTKSAKSSKHHPIEIADLRVARRAARWRNYPLVRFLGAASELADQPPLYALCAATAGFGFIRGDMKLVRAGGRMLAAEWLATKAKGFLKHRIDRTRPHVPIDGGRYRLEEGSSEKSALNSFPSGHTAGAVAVARAYSSEYPEHAAVAASLALTVALIQLPRCKHFLTDIGAGAAIGLGVGSLVSRR